MNDEEFTKRQMANELYTQLAWLVQTEYSRIYALNLAWVKPTGHYEFTCLLIKENAKSSGKHKENQ